MTLDPDVSKIQPTSPLSPTTGEKGVKPKLTLSDSKQVSVSAFAELKTEILDGFRRAVENIKSLAREIFGGIGSISSTISQKISSHFPRMNKTSEVAERQFEQTEPQSHGMFPTEEAEELEMKIKEEELDQEIKALIGDDPFIHEAVTNLANALIQNANPEENALSIYDEINSLINKMAQKDAEVAIGGADLSRALIRTIAKSLAESQAGGQVKAALDKEIDEDKLFDLVSGEPLQKAKEAMQKDLDQRVKNNEVSNVERLQTQIDAYDAHDIVPNVSSMYMNFKKALT